MTDAAIYCRRSTARYGDTTHVDDQRKISMQLADYRDWHVSDDHVYVDNAISAWKRDRKRDGWDALLAAIEAGEVQAIVVYHGDRLMRQPRDLEDLLDIAERRGVRLTSPTGERDLDNPDDRFVLRIEVAHACREVDNTSRRMKRRYERLAEQGLSRPGGRGGRAFGFETDGVTHREKETDALADGADRVLDGEEVGKIVNRWNDAGLRTTAGRPWTHGTFKKTMMRPRIAGLLERNGVIVGKAAWKPILPEETWRRVVEALTDKERRFSYATNTRRYLMSGIAACGTCGHPVAIRHNTRSESLRGYGCINPACELKVHRNAAHVDAYVEGHVLALLNDDQFVASLDAAADPDVGEEITALTQRRAETEEQLANLADHPGLSPGLLARSLASFDRRISELRGTVEMSRRRRLLREHAGISLWRLSRLPLERRRALVRAAYRVTILPSSKRGPGFDTSSVRLELRTD